MSFAQDFDLDSLLQEFDLYHKMSAELCKERMKLLKCLDLANCKLTEANLREQKQQRHIESLQELIQSSHKALSAKCDLEVDNIRLKQDLNAAQLKLTEIEQSNLAERSAAENRQRQLSELHKLDLVSRQEKLTGQFVAEAEVLRRTIDEQAARMNDLETQFVEYNNEKQSELMRVRLEYEDRLQKMQKQLATLSSSSTSQLSVSGQEIYRKKLQHLKEESEREIANLRRENNELKQQLSSQPPHQSSVVATRRLYRHQ